MKNKKAVVIQCRLSSTRLPNKALKMLDNKCVLEWVLNSMHKIPTDRYFVATDEASFEYLKPICIKNNFEIFKGDLNNVLKRFCDLITEIDADVIIRATADNPFLFYEAAIDSLNEFENILDSGKKCDYLTYSGLPHGSGVEIINAKSLLEAAKNTDSAYDKEHVGPALYNHKDKFECYFINAPEKYNYPSLRSTIDTWADFLRAKNVVYYVKNTLNFDTANPFPCEQIVKALNSDFVRNPVIYIPSVVAGHGTGHLLRCLDAAIKYKNFIYIPDDATLSNKEALIENYYSKGLEKWQIINQLSDKTYPAVFVTDYFKIHKDLYKQLENGKTVISIDEGRKELDKIDYLLDIIPSYKLNRKPNDFNLNLISRPENKKTAFPGTIQKILVTIGGEDPASLTAKSCEIIKTIYPDAKIYAIDNGDLDVSGVEILQPVKNLKEKLWEYDLIVTHYGLTAFEALSANCHIVLVSTSKLHENLAKTYNFPYVPYKKLNSKNFLLALESLKDDKIIHNNTKNQLLSDEIFNLSLASKLNCPVCGDDNIKSKIISRNKTRTYKRCDNCSINYISWTSIPERKYEKSYFFNEYKNQYGKTYTDDFESIKKTGFLRISHILKLLNTSQKSILDIGCAYGPFLSAAKDSGFEPFGTDISQDAIEYVKKELNIECVEASFPDFDSLNLLNKKSFDCCTMWYVIEHFKDLDLVLKKVNSLVNQKGVFAFSTPSAQGVSAKSDVHHFYEISPSDHYSVWDFKSAKKIMKKYGFKVKKIVSTGHHPERFTYIKNHNIKPDSIVWKIVFNISKIFKLGDTMEIYCQKIKDFEL